MAENPTATVAVAQLLLAPQMKAVDPVGSAQPAAAAQLSASEAEPAGETTLFADLLAGIAEPIPVPAGLGATDAQALEKSTAARTPTTSPMIALQPASGTIVPSAGVIMPLDGDISPLAEPSASLDSPALTQPAAPLHGAPGTPAEQVERGSQPVERSHATRSLPPGQEIQPATSPGVQQAPAPVVPGPGQTRFHGAADPSVPAVTLPEIEPGALETSLDSGGQADEQPTQQRQQDSRPAFMQATDQTSRTPQISFERTDGPGAAMLQPSGYTPAQATSSLAQAIGLSLPSDRAGWADPLAQRLAAVVNKGMNTADLRLSPAHLGRIEVRISIHADQASVWVSSPNPEVREALQQALPRLDNLLEDLGIQLTNADVSDQSFDGFMNREEDQAPDPESDGATSAETSTSQRPTLLPLGIVDTYV